MTTQQQINIEKNSQLFDAYDSIIKAASINEIPFDEFLEMMKTLHEIKIRKSAAKNQIKKIS